jgi:alkanesulfonate monooxygenase SsuD/methylene tetrahydromethanopterin reductase-like flavin-dependent oxidoreductase (luciferase family)
MSPRAIDRAARIGDGWVALSHLDRVDPPRLGEQLQQVLEGRAPGAGPFLTVLRIVGDLDPEEARRNAEAVHELAGHGYDEIAVDLPLPDVEAAREVYEVLAAAIA